MAYVQNTTDSSSMGIFLGLLVGIVIAVLLVVGLRSFSNNGQGINVTVPTGGSATPSTPSAPSTNTGGSSTGGSTTN